ncbi:MAG: anthranilate synthase component I family protein [Candidatus Dormibacteraeota bacterium]|nr:anthranilate synthase component I family protein [Candidatus Dormibacteraeota bacterium]
MSCTPSLEEAREYAREFQLIPVYRDLLGDMLTPVRAYGLLCPPGKRGFLLESVEGGERLARYSFIGYQPSVYEMGEGDPLRALAEITEARVAPVAGLPRFHGGVVGYLSYEVACHFERLPTAAGSSPELPPSFFMRAEDLVVFDHVTHRLRLLTIHRPDRESYADACGRLDQMERLLEQEPPGREAAAPPQPDRAWESNVTERAYCAMVEAAREEIHSGEAFQVVLSQRFRKQFSGRPLDVYRCLRSLNPSPYMYYLDLGDSRQIVGTSPEVLVQVEGRRMRVRPLAGTRSRGSDAGADAAMEADLLADPKERAEHIMLVDLGRNDVGRVARPGSVVVDRLMDVERYSRVMHISSTVSGELAEGRSSLDAVRAAFPAGTVSGAPKIRAMEIIAALEPDRRGPYSGALGYVSFGGNLDLAITLRTIVIAGHDAFIQAGAGVVADSVPEHEYRETLAKASVLFEAIRQAEAMP